MNYDVDAEKMRAILEETDGGMQEEKKREKHVFNVSKAASVTLWLRHCTRDL